MEYLETKLVRLRFLSLNEIPKAGILKVVIKVDQGASTFWMREPLGVNDTFEGHFKENLLYMNGEKDIVGCFYLNP